MTEQNSSNPSSPNDPLGEVVDFKKDLPVRHPALFKKPHTAEWLLRERQRNGLDKYVRFVGRTAFITMSDFTAWYRSRSTAPADAETLRAAASLHDSQIPAR